MNYVGGNSLSKNTSGVSAEIYPNEIEVKLHNAEISEDTQALTMRKQPRPTKTAPKYFSRDNRVLIMHNGRVYKINGKH